MEIKLVKNKGVPKAEIEAHQQIKQAFSSTAFSNAWQGYASFALARRGAGAGDDDFDLVIVTHSNIIAVELKNWHGKVLESDGQDWFIDGESRSSPIESIRLKAKKLANIMTQKLGRERTPFITSLVVMHGSIETIKLNNDEEESVLNLTEFLSLRFEHCYKKYFSKRPRFNPLDNLKEYDSFFQGPSFRPKDYFVDGFRPEEKPILEHPNKLYSEFKANAKDDPTKLALLRQWDFSALGLDLIGHNDRSFIGLREQRVFEYVADRNEELSLSLLRPVTRKGPNDVTLDFSEVFILPNKITRLAEFTHNTLSKLSTEERVTLVKAMLNRFAELHDLRVAHRDIGEHSLWIDRPSKVVMSGFPAAYYPEMQTVGAFREKVKIERSLLPEDITENKSATPYRRDVFMLGALAYLLFFGEKPPKVSSVYEWAPRAEDPFNGTMNKFIEQALSHDAALRFQNAREMLEALNAATTNQKSSIIDITVFDAFKATTRERDYTQSEIFDDTNEYTCFRSDSEDTLRLVKVWYGVEPDIRKPDLSIKLLSFLERARTIKGCGIQGIPKIIDFGLSRRSLLVVHDWIDGQTLPTWLASNPTLDQRMGVSRSLTDTLQRLHALEIAHGDIHPQNIIVKDDGSTVLIDALDFHLNADDFYTTAYLPENYKSLTLFERDRYSLAAVLSEIFGSAHDKHEQDKYPIPRVYEELDHLLSAQTISTLDPLAKSLLNAIQNEAEDIPEFTLVIRNLDSAGELRSDNGTFYISVQKDRKDPMAIRIWVTGIGRQILFVWKLAEEIAVSVKIQNVPQSQFLRSQTMRDAQIRMRLDLVAGPVDDVRNFVQFLLQNEQIKRKLPGEATKDSSATTTYSKGSQQAEAPDEKTATVKQKSKIPVPELWQALLDAEEESFITVTIAGEMHSTPYRDGQVLIPYHADLGVIDYTASDTVIVESQTPEGLWKPCGQLNLRETTFGQLAELAISHLNSKANLRIGSKLRLISNLEKGSFTRRRFAVERILQDKAVIPNLIYYFERDEMGSLPLTTYEVPTDEELDVYSEGEKQLNTSQKDAFRSILRHGPISLLQGPPGTGKTWFIACFLHYLMTKERVRRILLVSQSHEAVNNALEKGLEFCRAKGVEFNAVRLGNESAASDAIRHLHASSIEQSYRERFKAEQMERIVRLATILGLPKEFSREFVDLYLMLGVMSERILKLQERSGTENESTVRSLDARVRALSETFFDIARDVYGFSEELPPTEVVSVIQQQLIEQYEVRSHDAIERLQKLLHFSEEWLSALGSPDANFAEFLAKSRTVVAGTLVGIGYRGAGVVQNIFDWVIIDEAGRAAPSELAVAMQAGHRVLLVGDHFQLPPTFSDEIKELIKSRFSIGDEFSLFSSDFERIFDSGYGKKVGTTLLRQYRMAPDIGELVSDCFYKGKLEPGRGTPPEYYDLLPEQFSKQVCWVDISTLKEHGIEQTSEKGEDRWNRLEAKVVMELLRQILESDDFIEFLKEDLQPQEPPIGIICMYHKQREIIDQMKAEAPWLGDARRLVKVDTVDSYQGKENRIIIISTVRNNPTFNPGFLRSPNRINVAMSRAMERLFIVGASKMWEGRNSALPLGKVLNKIKLMAAEGKAGFLPASQFMAK